MNDNGNLIWKQLQQHSMQPPGDTFEKVWQHILQQQVQSKDSTEWKTDVLKDAEIKERSILSNLQQYSVTPPALQWGSTGPVEKKSPSQKKHTFYLSLAKAAAVLLLAGGAAFFGISVILKKKNKPGSDVTTVTKTAPSSPTPVTVAVNDTPVTFGQSQNLVQPKSISKDNESKKKTVLSLTNNASWASENDLLFTLVNFKDAELQKLGAKLLNNKKITLSQYSYINLSDKMVQMIRDLCGVKRNGKPDKNAKKTKRKFERWKKADEKYFDRGPQKNPADIIDLSDFIIKK